MKRYFNTKEGAEAELERRRISAKKRHKEKGWNIVSDNSYVYQDYKWIFENNDEMCKGTRTDELKWFVMILIVTDELLRVLKEI